MRLYYNPRCSKSRRARELLEEAGQRPELVDYLNEPPSEETLGALIDALGEPPAALVREAGEHDAPTPSGRDAVVTLLAAQPQRLQRPILAVGTRAVIARPPERVFELQALFDQEPE